METKMIKYPEWKQLYDSIKDRLEPGQMYSYEDLSVLLRLNCRSLRGRQQFLRFAKEVLVTLQLHFQNVRNQGYRVVLPKEHGQCAINQLALGRKRIKKGAQIDHNVRIECLTDEECRKHTDRMARWGRLAVDTNDGMRDLRRIEFNRPSPRLPSPINDTMKELTDKPTPPTGCPAA